MKFKRFIFTVILILIPICFFVLIELSLSVLSMYDEHPLFISDNSGQKELYRVNPYVAQRYFPPSSPTLPTLYPQPFGKEKSANTVRIFCLGGSTTEGFPFDEQVPFPQQLKFMLQESLPDKNIEVINLGISAVNSYIVADLLPEVIKMQPDAIILYMGHNEFYGVYGSASGLTTINTHFLVKTYLYLRKFRTVRMLQSWLQKTSSKNNKGAPQTLMAAAAHPNPIEINSKLYKQTLENFTANLSAIEALCRNNRIPLVLGTLISNEKDLPPFQYNTTSAKKNLNDEITQYVYKNITANDFQHFQQLMSILNLDDEHNSAIYSFLRGKLALSQGDTLLAKTLFIKSRDLDGIRFRASSELNDIIRRFTRQHNLLLADVESHFRARSPGGIIGKTLVCDHLHPNPNGYFLMAKSFYEALTNVFSELQHGQGLGRTEPYFVSDIDWEIGLLKIHSMTRRWPFAEQPTGYEHYRPYSNKDIADIAYNYIFNHHQWVRAQFETADYWLSHKQPTNSIAVLRAVMAMYPKNTLPIIKIAKIYMQYSNWSNAIKYLVYATQLNAELGTVHMLLAECYMQTNNADKAIKETLLALNSLDLLSTEKRYCAIRVAKWLSQNNRTQDAELVLRDLIKRFPTFEEAKILISHLAQ